MCYDVVICMGRTSMGRLNAIALRIREKGSLSLFELMKAENIGPSYIEKLKPYLLDAFQDIGYKDRVFYVVEKK